MFQMKKDITIQYDPAFAAAGTRLREYLDLFYGIRAKEDKHPDIELSKAELPEEHYTLTITADHIRICAGEIKAQCTVSVNCCSVSTVRLWP